MDVLPLLGALGIIFVLLSAQVMASANDLLARLITGASLIICTVAAIALDQPYGFIFAIGVGYFLYSMSKMIQLPGSKEHNGE